LSVEAICDTLAGVASNADDVLVAGRGDLCKGDFLALDGEDVVLFKLRVVSVLFSSVSDHSESS
jgi:hypothetical protein